MTLQQLTYFLAAAEHGSFSRAARALYLAQPSLSEQVRALETGARRRALRAGRPRRRPDRGRPGLPARGGARARRARSGPRGGRRGARAARRHAQHRHVRHGVGLPALAPRRRLPLAAPRRLAAARRPELLRGGGGRAPRRLEAALVVLPVDDDGLDVRPARREEVVYVSREPERVREPMPIERLADVAADPLRRPLRLERPDPPAAAGAGAAGRRPAQAGDRDRGHGGRARARRQRARRHGRPAGGAHAAAPLPIARLRLVRRAALRHVRVHRAARNAPVSPAARAFVELAERRLAEFGEGVLYAGIGDAEPEARDGYYGDAGERLVRSAAGWVPSSCSRRANALVSSWRIRCRVTPSLRPISSRLTASPSVEAEAHLQHLALALGQPLESRRARAPARARSPPGRSAPRRRGRRRGRRARRHRLRSSG